MQVADKAAYCVAGHAEVRRSRRLVLSFISTVVNYEYAFYWYFYQVSSLSIFISSIIQPRICLVLVPLPDEVLFCCTSTVVKCAHAGYWYSYQSHTLVLCI